MTPASFMPDASTILYSLKVSLIVTGIFSFVLGTTLPLRLHTIWKGMRLARIPMPCQDAEPVRFRVAEAFKMIGKATPPITNGSFTIEPSNWRKQLGVRAVTVDFPEPGLAMITGPAGVLGGFARRQKLPLQTAPGAPTYGMYLKQKMKPFVWLLGNVFVAVFLTVAIANPPRPGSRSRVAIAVENTPALPDRQAVG